MDTSDFPISAGYCSLCPFGRGIGRIDFSRWVTSCSLVQPEVWLNAVWAADETYQVDGVMVPPECCPRAYSAKLIEPEVMEAE
jgi:hypothetical protein